MDSPRSPRPLERLARMRAGRVDDERSRLAAALALLATLHLERDQVRAGQREAEVDARSGLPSTGEARTAALEALVLGSRRLAEARARVREARTELRSCQERLESERAQERVARELSLERARAVQLWKLGREQDEVEEAFRVRPGEI